MPNEFNRDIKDFEFKRVSDLREFSETFFKFNSLSYINWWNYFKGKSADKAEMVVKCVGVNHLTGHLLIEDG